MMVRPQQYQRRQHHRRKTRPVSPLFLVVLVFALLVTDAFSSPPSTNTRNIPAKSKTPTTTSSSTGSSVSSTSADSLPSTQQEDDTMILVPKNKPFFPWPSNFTDGSFDNATVSSSSMGIKKGETRQKDPILRRKLRLSPEQVQFRMILSLLSLSAVVKAICYRYYKCFPDVMTGCTVKVLDSIVECQGGVGRWKEVTTSTSMVAMYIAGTAIYKALDLYHHRHHGQQQQQQQIAARNQKNINVPIARTIHRTTQLTLLAFGLSDLVDYWLFPLQPFPTGRLPFLSLGFGMINAASGHLFGAVTNAITGHWNKIGAGLAESLFAVVSSTTAAVTSTTINVAQKKTTHPSALQTSAWGMVAFSLSLMATSGVLRVVEAKPWWLRSAVAGDVGGRIGCLPPLGLSLGLVYGAVLMGYSKYLMEAPEELPL